MKKMLVTFLCAMMLLTGCGGSGKQSDYDFKDYILKGYDIESFNYLNSSSAVNTKVIVNLISGLVDTNKYGVIVGDMAEKWEHNEDYTEWTFHLRDGVKWFKRDGSEYADVKAQDWVSAMKWELTAENGSTCTQMATSHLVNAEEYLNGTVTDFSEVGIKAVDDKTLVYTLKDPAPWFDTVVLYGSFYPMNQDFYDEVVAQGKEFGSTPETILYNGAYILTEYTNDSDKLFEANPGYWDADSVNLKTVSVIAVKDVESTKELYERGELDYATLSETQIVSLSRDENEYMFKTDPIACSYVFFMNNWSSDENTAKAFANENFRKAIFYGWNREEYVGRVDPLDPQSIYSYGYTPKDFIQTSDGTDYTQLPALKDWQKDQYDPAKGAQYMATAKAELQAQGVTFPVTIPYFTKAGNETQGQTAQILKATLEECLPDFVELEIGEYTQSFTSEVLSNLDHGMAGAGWVPDYKDPSNQLGSIVPGPAGYMNNTDKENPSSGYSHWDFPEFVELFNKACAEVSDLDLRYNLFAEAEAYLLEHAYFIPLYEAGTTYQLSNVNNYTRTYSKTGGVEYRYKGLEVHEEAITREQMAQYKADWQKARVEAIQNAGK